VIRSIFRTSLLVVMAVYVSAKSTWHRFAHLGGKLFANVLQNAS
jgi:hypothetical protein